MTHPTIKIGSAGDAVRNAQQALWGRGYYLGSAGVDGFFGVYSDRAVRYYQCDRASGEYWALPHPLAVEGIVGPQTWAGWITGDPQG